jgi:hypothetical protein
MYSTGTLHDVTAALRLITIGTWAFHWKVEIKFINIDSGERLMPRLYSSKDYIYICLPRFERLINFLLAEISTRAPYHMIHES